VDDYIPWITLTNSTSAARSIELTQNAYLGKNLRVVGTSTLSDTVYVGAGVKQSVASTATSPAYAVDATAATGLYGAAASIGLAVGGNAVFLANASTTAIYRNGVLVAAVNADSFNFAVTLETAGSVVSGGNVIANGNASFGGNLGVGGTSVFTGGATFSSTVVFNGHVTFNSTATLPPINLVDLNDVTYLTGTTLEQYFTEIGLNPSSPATAPASGANIKAVFNALGQTQEARVQTALYASLSASSLSVAAMLVYQTAAFYNSFNAILGGKPFVTYCVENERQYQLVPVRDPSSGVITDAIWVSVDYEISRLEASARMSTTPTLPVNPASTSDWSYLGQFPYFSAYAFGNGEIRVPFSCQEIDMAVSLNAAAQSILPERAGIDVARTNLLFRLLWVNGDSTPIYWDGKIIASSCNTASNTSAVWTLRFSGNGVQVPQHSTYGSLLPVGHTMPGFVLCAARASAIGGETGLAVERLGVRASMKFRELLPLDYGNAIVTI
jgi:hypothetical protein